MYIVQLLSLRGPSSIGAYYSSDAIFTIDQQVDPVTKILRLGKLEYCSLERK